MIDAVAVGLAARRGLQLAREDPLRFRRMSSVAQRRLFEYAAAGLEVAWRAGNQGGKTYGGAHLGVALARGLRRIDGRLMHRPGEEPDPADDAPHWIELPELEQPTRWWVLVRSYDQAKDSSMKAYRELLGRHPHSIAWLDKAGGKVKTLRVKYEGCESDHPDDWSEITFVSQENVSEDDVQKFTGARLDGVHADEPPDMHIWREMRARGQANRRFFRWVTFTPIYREQWEQLKADFDGCYENPTGGKVEIRSSVEDNRALSREHLEALRVSWQADPKGLFRARWDGDYVDVTGGSPFHLRHLERWAGRARPGKIVKVNLRKIRVAREPEEEDGREPVVARSLAVEMWRPREKLRPYLLVVDPSRGIDDPEHDPGAFIVGTWSEPWEIVCAHTSYANAYSLGFGAGLVGRYYNAARVDVEMNGGYGDPALLALRRMRYPNIGHEDFARDPGRLDKRMGWNTNPTSRGEMIAAIQEQMEEDTVAVWSKAITGQLAGVREDRRGKAAGKGRNHDEFMICLGRYLHIVTTVPAPKLYERRGDTGFEAALRKDFGRPIQVRRRSGRVSRATPEAFRR